MNSNHNTWDEDRMAELLRTEQSDVIPPNEAFLARLRAASTEAFQSSVPASSPAVTPASKRKSKMYLLASRALAAAATVVIAVTTWYFATDSGGNTVTLAQLLEKTEKADSLHLQIVQTDKETSKKTEAWTDRAEKMRVNHSEGIYDIAHGEKLWQINEKANRAASEASPYYLAGSKSLDLLPLLDAKGELPAKIRKNLRVVAARPIREKIGGEEYDVYRFEASDAGRSCLVEAKVDPATRLLHSLETLVDRDGRRTPSVTLTVLNVNQPVNEDLFVVGDTLTEDGRIGKVIDVQGMVSIKPVMAERWTPVVGNILLKPGDWLQTELRGANAVAAHLAGQTQITAGPGTLVELATPKKIRLYEGEIKIAAAPNAVVELLGPGEQKMELKESGVYRVEKEKLARVEQEPKWLKGFVGNEVQESIGSLVANVDGRNEPLTVGYHKVSVEIRDQIARTTIEESFVNHANTRLEGVFYFPLPQDASISGFGMWIGNELVEADIVEKQRAREIYEEILREKRDPGLLEWSGGNLFKARVFPIEANSEKRIRIVYTQVLPLRGNSFRYSYALQSEMLKQHPLRELSIDVKINSVIPLKSVTSPTHDVRKEITEHSAHLEFEAKEYTPRRDFEVVAEVDKTQEITLIPHRRGDDGYFMLMLMPPSTGSQDDRDLLTDKEPLDIIFLADTSASLDAQDRAAQADFIAAVMQSLTARDTFNLACMDVECDWAFEKAVSAEAKNIEAARQFLGGRNSLGWTDLAKAFSAAFARAGRNTCIIYVGDGIPTTGDADPAAASAQLRRIYEEKSGGNKPVCYAVSVGSTFESGVLKTIGSLGGGSMRQITGEQTPRIVALELLKEITRPALRNLKVQFEGLRVARVYPEQLPNLPAGSQQILLGRYLPQGTEQSGEILVTGRQGDRDIQFKKTVSLVNAEEGNSFIPRLWARMHLDYLLQQGATPAIKDDIIALSEEYHIMTPYTSLLVLESDADRERFKVKRAFQMRDGEKFFAEGRDNANFELIQQQMKRAGGWRLGLRNSVLQQFSNLGRDASVFSPYPHRYPTRTAGAAGRRFLSILSGFGGDEGDMNGPSDRDLYSLSAPIDMLRSNSLGVEYWDVSKSDFSLEDIGGVKNLQVGIEDRFGADKKSELSSIDSTDYEFMPRSNENFNIEMPRLEESTNRALRQRLAADQPMSMLSESLAFYDRRMDLARKPMGGGYYEHYSEKSKIAAYYRQHGEVDGWLNGMFGTLPPAPADKKPAIVKPDWPEEVFTLSKNLLRTAQFALSDGGLQIDAQTDNFDPRFKELTSQSNSKFLTNAESWLIRSAADGGQTTVQWCDGKERGIFNQTFQLGRLRKAVTEELKNPPAGLSGFVLSSLEDAYRNQKVSIEHPADGQTLLTFRYPGNEKNAALVLIDTKRNVVLSVENRNEGKTTSKQQFADFVEVAGSWWAGKIESFDDQGRLVAVTKQKIERLDRDPYIQMTDRELADRKAVQFLRDPGELVIDAKKALAAGKASFDDQITLMMHFAQSGQWTRMLEHLAAAEKLATDKPGLRWLRYAVMKSARHHEELKNLFQQEAAALAKAARADDLYTANYLLGQANGVLESNEMLTLLDSLQLVFARQPAHLQSLKSWRQQRANYLSNCGRGDESLALYRELAEAYPHDFTVQMAYVQNLQSRSEFEAQRKWIERVLSSGTPWLPGEIQQFRDGYAQSLRSQERYGELVAYLANWTAENPESYGPYEQYITALWDADLSKEADALVDKWFQEGRREDASPAVYARLQAAVNWVRNSNNNFYDGYGQHQIDQRWQKQLIETAVFFCRHNTQVSLTEQILSDWRFNQTEGNQKLRAELAKIFAAQFDRLTLDEINRFIGWLRGNDELVKKETWNDYARRLQERYATIDSPRPLGEGPGVRAESPANPPHPNPLPKGEGIDLKNRYAMAVANILSFAAGPEEYLAYLRRLSAEAPEKYRPYYISQLFQTLLNQQWSEKYENEAFELLEKLGGNQTPEQQLVERIRALMQLTDRMLQIRNEAIAKTIEHPEKLTRTELAAKQAENLRKTREEFADRLAREETKHTGELAKWIAAERLYLDVLLNRNLENATEICWKVLDAKLPKIDENSDAAAMLQADLDAALRNRYLVMLMNLTARKSATPAQVRRMLDYLDANIARELAENSENQLWKLLKYELLIALDKPQDLEKALGDWIKAGDADNRWRVALGYLLAEQGKLAEAIARFEAVAAADELGPAEYRTLADWYMAVNRRADYENSRVKNFQVMEEWRLNQWIGGQMRRWQDHQGPSPSQLDPEVILAFRALLAKSGSPQNYLNYPLREFYRVCRDFRLLSCVAESIPGHTAGQIYPYLQASRSVLDEIRDEAAVDSLIEQIVKLREQAKTDVDRRAFDLLEAMTERRAAELRNQPGPHVDKAVFALERAFNREWSPGETKLMADFLAELGRIPQEKLAAAQLRQLEAFYNGAKPDSQERLDMACAWAKALWSYDRRQQALDLLESEINRYAAAGHATSLGEQRIFNDYISYLDQFGRYTQTIEKLKQQLEKETKITNRRNLQVRIYEVQLSALRNRGQVGELKGDELYRVLQKNLLAELPSGDAGYDHRLLMLLSSLYQESHNLQIAAAANDLKAFAFEKLLELLKGQVQQYENLINNYAECVHQVCGPAEGIRFLLDGYNYRPMWLKNRQNFWNAHGSSLNNWRREAKNLDTNLSDRLFQVVVEELRKEMLIRRTYNMPICYKSYPGEFWAEREADFLRVAEEIYAQNKKNGRIVVNVADYLTQGLERMDRAIEILQTAEREKLLDEGGQAKLIDYLHNRNRFGESIGLLQMLVEKRPDNLDYHRLLMHAYFRTNRKDDLLGLLKKTDEYFHQVNRWGEAPMAMLAGSCLQNELFEQSIRYYKELIPLHERTAANRGIGDGTLSGYYGGEAQAFAGLHKTPEAVEAACGAIISWGRNTANRAQALESLRNVLRGCEKLDAYTAELDAQVAQSGRDNPLVRKALGQVYSERGQYDKAVAQLRMACDLQPNDAEIHQALVACYDKQNDKQGAIRQLIASVQLSRRDINLYKELGRRLAELHEDRESERAYTSIVEVLALESESHAMLAEIRESQNRWNEAIGEWREVARIRALEPTGLLRLAAAQVHEKEWAAAAETVSQLRAKAWPPRFGDIENQIQELERLINQGKGRDSGH